MGQFGNWAAAKAHHFMTELVNYHQERMLELFGKTLTVIADGLKAEKQVLYEGRPVNFGPDHPVRLTAAKRLSSWLPLDGRCPTCRKGKKKLTLEQLQQYFEKRSDKS